MTIIDINATNIGGEKWYRTNNTGSFAGITNSDFINASLGFMYDMPDYAVFIVSSSVFSFGGRFEATLSDYAISDVTISGSVQFLNITESFIPGRSIHVSMSRNDSFNQMISTFSAVSSDYIMYTASLDIKQSIDLYTVSNVDPNSPDFPSAPINGNIDMNRFRKTYTHVRAKPRIRKYSTST